MKRNRVMANLSKSTLLVIIGLLVMMCNTRVAKSIPNTNVTQVLCNSGTYTSGDPFATSLAYVLADLEATTPTRKNFDYYNISPYPNAFAYGHGTCSQNLTSDSDCTACLGAAKTAMFGTCAGRIGSRAMLHDCGIRYEQYPFNE